ncbi:MULTISPECIES: SDR family oxidoreductase [unclassified Cupriavidus]|uniref:SDR family oxidoreductase n=1 Tax=unclassified Cupriavidus TaxID=2640874 RepID=UPI00295F1623|nr:SDR family oxidoreductase [Cupriavidus sp. TA19]
MANRHQEGSVLVTGGSNGIGRATIERLLEDGYDVINLDIARPTHVLPGETYVEADLANPDSLREALLKATSGRHITRLVNNAGIVRPAAIDVVTASDLQAVVAVNLTAVITCVQAVLPAMREAKFGRIVNISSRAALGKSERIAYSATKAGLHGLTRTLALELAAECVTVNAIGPGPIATELFQRVNPAGAPATTRIVDAIPVRRMGEPAEVAHMVSGLLDARAGFTTGQVIYVCGGMTVGLAT